MRIDYSFQFSIFTCPSCLQNIAEIWVWFKVRLKMEKRPSLERAILFTLMEGRLHDGARGRDTILACKGMS